MSTRVPALLSPLAFAPVRRVSLFACVALFVLGGAPATAGEPAGLARFHNALGARVRLSRPARLLAAWRATREPDVVGASSRAFQKAFLPAWRRLAPPNVEPFSFGGSGTEINNALLHELATQTLQRQGALGAQARPRDAKRAPVLVMEGAFVARNGTYSDLGFQRAGRGGATRDVLPSVLYQTLEDKPLIAKERAALRRLAGRLRRGEVGAVLLEPIPSAHGVLFYRPAFLRGVRALCDHYAVPLVFDEVYTAGGVSGRFFAYQHYGVEPDFVTFGKGLVPGGAGVARVQRQGRAPSAIPAAMAGFKVDPALLHKGALVLDRIFRGHLIERAQEKGRVLREGLARLQDKSPRLSRGADGRLQDGGVRGIGLLIYAGALKSADGKPLARLQPPLDTSTRELQRFLRQLGVR